MEKLREFTNKGIFKKIFPLGFIDEFKIIVLSAIPIVEFEKNFDFLIFPPFLIKNLISFSKILGNISGILVPMSSVLFCGQIGPEALDAVSLANTV